MWEQLPSTKVAWVQFPHLAPHVKEWDCRFSNSALRGFSPGTPVFSCHQKPTFDSIWLVNNDCERVIWTMLIYCRIVKRISSYIHANLRKINWALFYHLTTNRKTGRLANISNMCFKRHSVIKDNTKIGGGFHWNNIDIMAFFSVSSLFSSVYSNTETW